ncbi:hypothetical protein GGQ73_003507 [Rhizobium skierniewicense]|uniref:Uncharacterized protein n=1 Tax=Rhizobium skierniewicense TaxID=984260 RepID=A0A7W6G3H5_9HYPH|nr:hypothetical protein [Rhizobium skierniewicense]
MMGASIETTLELWASSLRDVKVRMRGYRSSLVLAKELDQRSGKACRRSCS